MEHLRNLVKSLVLHCNFVQLLSYLDLHRRNLSEVSCEILSMRRQRVAELMLYLFPISQVSQSRSETESFLQSTVNALAEARRMSYLRGRWVYTDNGGDHQYQIVEPELPGTGDYSQYTLWVQENEDTVRGPNSHIDQRNAAYTIGAALAFTTQLVNVLSYLLDINLPHRLCYSEFCGHDLSESKFCRLVQRLNLNVLHLCFSQQVAVELLHPRHTVHNLLMLLQATNLGRNGEFLVDSTLVSSLEEGCTEDRSSDEGGWSEEDNEDVTVEGEEGEREWEHVPVNLPDMEIIQGCPDPYQSTSPTHTRTDPSTTTGGGLITSAAASVTSWWRGYTTAKK